MSRLDEAIDAIARLLDRSEEIVQQIRKARIERRYLDAALLSLELTDIHRAMVQEIRIASEDAARGAV